jgi:hypothetical protein
MRPCAPGPSARYGYNTCCARNTQQRRRPAAGGGGAPRPELYCPLGHARADAAAPQCAQAPFLPPCCPRAPGATVNLRPSVAPAAPCFFLRARVCEHTAVNTPEPRPPPHAPPARPQLRRPLRGGARAGGARPPPQCTDRPVQPPSFLRAPPRTATSSPPPAPAARPPLPPERGASVAAAFGQRHSAAAPCAAHSPTSKRDVTGTAGGGLGAGGGALARAGGRATPGRASGGERAGALAAGRATPGRASGGGRAGALAVQERPQLRSRGPLIHFQNLPKTPRPFDPRSRPCAPPHTSAPVRHMAA